MALFHGTIFSHTLGMQTGLSVILPQNRSHVDEDGRFPVLFLLHGLSDNASAWTSYTSVTRYAEYAGIAVVMPEVQRSFYTDMAYGIPYFRYVSEELPQVARELFPLSLRAEHTYVAGLSMGGYGAMKLALRFPDRFAAVGSFSGATDVRSRMNATPEENPEAYALTAGHFRAEDDLFSLTAQAAKQHVALPAIYMTMGLSDFLYEDCKRFRQQMDFLKIPYVYEEWAGVHDWNVWDRSIKQFLQFIGF